MTTSTTSPEFILMLTHNDSTVPNAQELAIGISNPAVHVIGFKDIGLSKPALLELANIIRQKGKKVALEVVSLDKSAEMRSAEMAVSLEVDFLMGGTHVGGTLGVIRGTKIKYFPFPGTVHDHPSKLAGTVTEITQHAQELALTDGVGGLDLLAYRHCGNAIELMQSVVSAVDVPVIVAGSIDSPERIASVTLSGAWGFTVGAAAINHLFAPSNPTIDSQIEAILRARDEAMKRRCLQSGTAG